MASEQIVNDPQAVRFLGNIAVHLQEIKANTLATSKAVGGKGTSAQEAKEGIKERTAIEKPGAAAAPAQGGKASAESIGNALISGVKNLFSKALDWAKLFGLVGFGIIFKDKIIEFVKGAFEPLKNFVSEWWTGTFLPAIKELDKAINPFSDDKGLFATVIDEVSGFATMVKDKIVAVAKGIDTFIEDLTGFSISDMILGKEGEDGAREGGIAGYIDKVGQGFIQFGKSIGILDDNGDFSLGASLGLGAIATAILVVKGPAKIIGGLFKAFTSVTGTLLKIGGKALMAPFTAMGAAARGLTRMIKGPAAKNVADATGAKAPRTGMAKVGENVERGKTASAKQLEKAGLGRDKAGGLYDKKTGQILKADDVGKRLDDAGVKSADKLGKKSQAKLASLDAPAKQPDVKAPSPKAGGAPKGGKVVNKVGSKFAAAAAKFPRLFGIIKFLKGVPGLGTALTVAPLLAAIAMGKGAKEIAPLAGALIGGVLGFKGGALLGGLIGAAGGPAALITGAVGGIGGALLGDSIGSSIAQAAMGLEADSMPWGFGWVDKLINKGFGSGGGGGDASEPVLTAGAAGGGEAYGGGATAPEPNIPSVAPGGAEAGKAAAKTATVNNDAVQKAVAEAKAASREAGQTVTNIPPPPAPPAKSGDKTDTIIIEMGKTKADITRSTMF